MFRGFYTYDLGELTWKWIIRGGDNTLGAGTCKHKNELKEVMKEHWFVEWSQPII